MPDLVMAFITAPLNFPYSASKLLVIRRNSSTESRFGTNPAPRFLPSLTSPPFTRNALAVCLMSSAVVTLVSTIGQSKLGRMFGGSVNPVVEPGLLAVASSPRAHQRQQIDISALPPGRYTINLSASGWIDVVQDGQFVRSVTSSGVRGCDGIRKSVKFEIPAKPFIIQISGVEANSISLAIVFFPSPTT